ncbi:TetR/AcrR family transcriptional regulator [Paenibacillus sp. ACRRX]|uniref:TetR/AcrR family transcriptional regulator n=1 Tax=Paenibacillus sp. ACRRX TaxID=2918206 RepID=UPI001EF3E540|nr:TetR/AcrR family transcriptional regulator [Paenibacillus sp. ACRRX]MCG7408764.1 TetR/AcrR family transcriptional regulator [Paenibacillus sp. ACRRX]
MIKKTKTSNRSIVMRVATTLFLEKGYQVTSMDEIVAVSKVSKTNIYYHFKSKEELLAAIVDQMVDHYNHIIDNIVQKTHLPVVERIGEITMLLSEHQSNSLGGCPFLTIYVQTSHEFEFVRETIGSFFQNQMHTIENLLQEGITRKEFSSQLPPSQLAALILSTIEGALFLQHTRKDPLLLPNILQTLAFMLK